jgi:hypothetical protein
VFAKAQPFTSRLVSARERKEKVKVVTLTMQHELHTSEDGFWTEIFESEEFNEALYEHLGLRYELESRDPATGLRRARVWPLDKLPSLLTSLLGGDVSLLEEGTRHPRHEHYDFTIVPTVLSDRILLKGSVSTEPLGPSACRRTVTMDIQVKILGLSGAVESLLERATREQYDDNAAFINDYLDKRR